MRISLVSEHANPLASPGSVDCGGQNVHVAALARALAERGHAVTVYTRRDDPASPERVRLCPNVDVVHVDAGPARRIAKDDLLPHMPRFAEELAAAWSADPPDIVHSHFWMSGLAALDGASGLGSAAPPVVHTYHALGSVKRRYQGAADTSPPDRIRIESELGNRADAVIATCSDEVRELREIGVPVDRVEIAPCGVDAELFSVDGPAERRGARFRLVSIGRLVPRKGVDLVIRALALLVDAGIDDIELEVAGSGDDVDGVDPELVRLTELARTLDISEYVHFRGPVARRNAPALLRSADAVLCTPWYEPFGIVPLESMACGAPVIVSAVGGLQDTVLDGTTGLHVPPQDPRAIADAVARLLADEPLRRALGIAGRARVEAHYTWDAVAERTEQIYDGVIARSGRTAHALAGVA